MKLQKIVTTSETVCVEFQNGKLATYTPEHRLFIKRMKEGDYETGIIPAKNLLIDDLIVEDKNIEGRHHNEKEEKQSR